VILRDIREPAHPERIGEPVTGPPSRIYDPAFRPDGASLAAAVTDGTAWLWDTSDPHHVTRSAVLGPFEGPTFTVAISPDGSLLAGSGGDQRIHLWPLDEGAAVDEWTTHVPDEPYTPPC
jgi:WD40 repeat protein